MDTYAIGNLKGMDYVDHIWAQAPGMLIVHCLIHYHLHQKYRCRAIDKSTLSDLQLTIQERWNDITHPHKEKLGIPLLGDKGLTQDIPLIVQKVGDNIYKILKERGHTFLTLKGEEIKSIEYAELATA